MRNADIAAGLRLELIFDKWEIVGHVPAIGPYDTKGEATEVLKGVQRFYRSLPDDPIPTLEDILS